MRKQETLDAVAMVNIACALYSTAQQCDKDSASFSDSIAPRPEIAEKYAERAKYLRALAKRIDEAQSVVLIV